MVRNGKENSVVAYSSVAIKSLRRNSNIVEFQFNILSISRIIYYSVLSTNVIRTGISKSRLRTKKRINERLSQLPKQGKATYRIFCPELLLGFGEKKTSRGGLGMIRGGLRMSRGG